MIQPVRPELALGWERYFTQKSGLSPDVPGQVLPVVVMDDNSRGPYPAYRMWQAGYNPASLVGAGVLSRWGIMNTDGFVPAGSGQTVQGQPGSVCVVEYIILMRDATAGGDFFLTFTHTNNFPFDAGSAALVADINPQKDVIAQARPTFANVQVGARLNAATIIGDYSGILPGHCDGVVRRVDGPWILGPGQILYVERSQVTAGFTPYARGRYYSAP
jgi:hypothetical protein